MDTATRSASVNQVLGRRYRLEAFLGEGAWNTVYRACDTKNYNRKVAVKILNESALTCEDAVSRFHQEVQLTQQLDHRNIVRIYSSGLTEDGGVYLVTEYCDGGDLGEYISSFRSGRGVAFFRAINILRFIARGLAHAHERKVVHRDLKPENILLNSALGVKIADFGIAKSLRFDSSKTGDDVIGTPSYMAPEQFEGSDVGPWSDVYSVGILAYQLLRGRLPFVAENSSRLMYQHCFASTPELTFKDSGIPCWMEDIVYKACAKEPARRFANGAQLSDAIERGLEQELYERGALGRLFYFVRPSGQFCTYLTEKGVSRRATKKAMTLFALTTLLLLLILIKISLWMEIF